MACSQSSPLQPITDVVVSPKSLEGKRAGTHQPLVLRDTLEFGDHFSVSARTQCIIDLRIYLIANCMNRTITQGKLCDTIMWSRKSFVISVDLIRSKLSFE